MRSLRLSLAAALLCVFVTSCAHKHEEAACAKDGKGTCCTASSRTKAMTHH